MKNRSALIIAFICSIFIGIAVKGEENIIKNGNFDKDFSGWKGRLSGKKSKLDPKNLLKLSKDTPDGKGNSLELNFASDDMEKYHSHSSGVIAKIKQTPKNTTIKISFKAKLIEGQDLLSIGRSNAGAINVVVEITDEWKEYTVEMKLPNPTTDLIFNLVRKKRPGIQRIDSGIILIDDVKITIIEKKKD